MFPSLAFVYVAAPCISCLCGIFSMFPVRMVLGVVYTSCFLLPVDGCGGLSPSCGDIVENGVVDNQFRQTWNSTFRSSRRRLKMVHEPRTLGEYSTMRPP